jgi:hypothetical protein
VPSCVLLLLPQLPPLLQSRQPNQPRRRSPSKTAVGPSRAEGERGAAALGQLAGRAAGAARGCGLRGSLVGDERPRAPASGGGRVSEGVCERPRAPASGGACERPRAPASGGACERRRVRAAARASEDVCERGDSIRSGLDSSCGRAGAGEIDRYSNFFPKKMSRVG